MTIACDWKLATSKVKYISCFLGLQGQKVKKFPFTNNGHFGYNLSNILKGPELSLVDGLQCDSSLKTGKLQEDTAS